MKIFLIISSLCFLSCAEKFPADHIINVDVKKHVCDQYRIVSTDPIKYKFEKAIPFEECPIVYGFELKDVAAVNNWIRRMQKEAKSCTH